MNEASKHLCVHEELKELSNSSGRMRFPKSVSLQLSGTTGPSIAHVEGIVSDQLNKEPNKCF